MTQCHSQFVYALFIKIARFRLTQLLQWKRRFRQSVWEQRLHVQMRPLKDL